MPHHRLEVAIGRKQDEVVPATELREKRVDSADLETLAVTRVPQLSGLDMVDSVGNEERQRPEALDDRVACLRPTETLQQFLQREPGREDPLPRFERIS